MRENVVSIIDIRNNLEAKDASANVPSLTLSFPKREIIMPPSMFCINGYSIFCVELPGNPRLGLVEYDRKRDERGSRYVQRITGQADSPVELAYEFVRKYPNCLLREAGEEDLFKPSFPRRSWWQSKWHHYVVPAGLRYLNPHMPRGPGRDAKQQLPEPMRSDDLDLFFSELSSLIRKEQRRR